MNNNYPKKINLQINEERYWAGLGKQEMSFHQVIGELIDNSISASTKDTEGELNPFLVEMTIEKLGNRIKIKIADQGIGMSEDELIENIFNPGGKGSSNGPLNEHGFGLKNAICVLTFGNQYPWKIQTRNEDSVSDDLYLVVDGPFSSSMGVDLDKKENWTNGLAHVKETTGTRVYAETPFAFFNTVYLKGKSFTNLIDRLIEHLGVTYRGYLASPYNKLYIRWRDLGDDEQNPTASSWNEFRVKAIEIPYDQDGKFESDILIDGPDGPTKVKYTRGNLDVAFIKNADHGKPYPLRIYYQGNRPTQGITITLRGRTLKTAFWPENWPEKHNDFNKFAGEIVIEDRKFKTVNNKISLDPHNPYGIRLNEILEEEETYKPQKVTNAKVESDIKKKIKIHLEGLNSNSKAELHRPIWGGAGVEVDIFHIFQSGEFQIYEVKAGTAAPLDVYQLHMYWDGIVKDENESPTLGRIVAKHIPDVVKNVIAEINKRKDAKGNFYKLEHKTLAELGV